MILTKRGGDKIGPLNNVTNIRLDDNLNTPSEISFTVHKHLNKKTCNYWNEIKNFRLIYVKEWNKYFEIYVSIDESDENTKSISGISLQESELSQIGLYDVEINTESDIAREDYIATTLYNPENPKASLLDRLLSDKASYYKIIHVDPSIANIQRTFSFDSITIYDAFMEIAEEINCLFIFGELSDESSIMRTISVYDLESNCNECGYRGEFVGKCPECGSTNILEGYGEDTTIFSSRENLTNDISFSTDTDSVKNCLRLEAGDDLMTATVINANPSGSQYLWNISDEFKLEMSDGLRERLNSYEKKYNYYQKEYKASIDPDIVKKYNSLIDKYKVFDKTLEPIITPIIGYSNIMKIYYDTIDFYGYLYNSLMPSVDISGITAQDQIALLTEENLSPVSVQNSNYISLATANSTITSYAKVYIDTARYKIRVKDSSINGNIWTGSFTIENYYDEDDTADSKILTIVFNDDYENFIKQQLDKILINYKEENSGIVELFKLDNDAFANELKKYSYTYLQILSDSCQSCLDILIEQGIGDEESWKYTEGNLYEEIYIPYYTKKNLIETEIIVRENEIAIIESVKDEYGDIKTKGLADYIDEVRESILIDLDFESNIGEYWSELNSFRREDTWENTNYISDGLTNSELFENAQKFLSAARKDIYKSANLQHSISTTLKNLLVIREFKPLIKYFKTGNWLRIQVDDEIYKLRLLHYTLDYDSLDTLSVDFSDVVKNTGISNEIKNILNQSKSIATSFNSVKRQAEQGSQSKGVIDNWIENGLNTATTKIVNGTNQDIVYDKHGLLFRKYNPDEGTYSPKQLKIINSILAITNDNWKTSKVGLGEFEFYNPKTQQIETGYGLIANQIVGSMMLSEEMGIYNKAGSFTIDENGLNITNGTNSISVNVNDSSLFNIKKGNVPVFTITDTGELSFTGNVTTETLILGTSGLYENNGTTSISIAPKDISILTLQKGSEKVLFFDNSGDLNIKAKVVAKDLTLDGFKIDENDIDGLNNYIKKDTVVGNAPDSKNTGFLLSSSGKLEATNATLYNPTIYTSSLTVENGGFEILNADNKKILYVSDSGDVNMPDAWDNPGCPVLSRSENKVKIDLNGDNLEIWVNKTLIATLPKGYSPTL